MISIRDMQLISIILDGIWNSMYKTGKRIEDLAHGIHGIARYLGMWLTYYRFV